MPSWLLPTVVASLAVITPRIAHGQAPDATERYGARALELRSSFFLSLEFLELYRGGKELSADDDSEIFAGSPRALSEASTYRTLTTIGEITTVAGFALLVAGAVVLKPWDDDGGDKRAGFLMMVGGIGITTTGSMFIGWGRSHLYDAVRVYNRELLARERTIDR